MRKIKCPKCKDGRIIQSIFGSCCSNEKCDYEPKRMSKVQRDFEKLKVTPKEYLLEKQGEAPKEMIRFKKGIKTIHIPLGLLLELPDGTYNVNPRKDILAFTKRYSFPRRAKLSYHVDFNNSGTREIRLCK